MFAEAVLALAGHNVTDPVLLDLQRRAAAGELTVDQATRLGQAHTDTTPEPREG